jgi:hypothetical protein
MQPTSQLHGPAALLPGENRTVGPIADLDTVKNKISYCCCLESKPNSPFAHAAA